MSGHTDMGEVLVCIAVAVVLYALTFGPLLFFTNRLCDGRDSTAAVDRSNYDTSIPAPADARPARPGGRHRKGAPR